MPPLQDLLKKKNYFNGPLKYLLIFNFSYSYSFSVYAEKRKRNETHKQISTTKKLKEESIAEKIKTIQELWKFRKEIELFEAKIRSFYASQNPQLEELLSEAIIALEKKVKETSHSRQKKRKTSSLQNDYYYYLSLFYYIKGCLFFHINTHLSFNFFIKTHKYGNKINKEYKKHWEGSFPHLEEVKEHLSSLAEDYYKLKDFKDKAKLLVIKEENISHLGNGLESSHRFSKLAFLEEESSFIYAWSEAADYILEKKKEYLEEKLVELFGEGMSQKLLTLSSEKFASQDLDIPISENGGTKKAILKAALHIISMIKLLSQNKENLKAFLGIIRPPGHHACTQECAGFCYLNNIILASKLALEKGYKKIAIIDFDLHTGDGTLRELKGMKDVYFLNLFCQDQYPFNEAYSFEHHLEEYSSFNHIKNIALADGTTWKGAYKQSLQKGLSWFPKKEEFDLVLISAGYDGSIKDRNSGFLGRKGFCLNPSDYEEMTRLILLNFPQAQFLLLTEGGYDPSSFSECLEYTLRAFNKSADSFL